MLNLGTAVRALPGLALNALPFPILLLGFFSLHVSSQHRLHVACFVRAQLLGSLDQVVSKDPLFRLELQCADREE